jgi:hypothetical protein
MERPTRRINKVRRTLPLQRVSGTYTLGQRRSSLAKEKRKDTLGKTLVRQDNHHRNDILVWTPLVPRKRKDSRVVHCRAQEKLRRAIGSRQLEQVDCVRKGVYGRGTRTTPERNKDKTLVGSTAVHKKIIYTRGVHWPWRKKEESSGPPAGLSVVYSTAAFFLAKRNSILSRPGVRRFFLPRAATNTVCLYPPVLLLIVRSSILRCLTCTTTASRRFYIPRAVGFCRSRPRVRPSVFLFTTASRQSRSAARTARSHGRSFCFVFVF